MQQKVYWSTMVAFGILWCCGSVATAQTLPTSENPHHGDWTRMNPSSFHGTIESAYEQCVRSAGVSDDDRLTIAHCTALEYQLSHSQCRVVQVPDGTVHDLMNARVNGRSEVTHNVRKMLGRLDQAYLCELGDGMVSYWYTGKKGESCNNVAFSFTVIEEAEPPPAVVVMVEKPEPEPEMSYQCWLRSDAGTNQVSNPDVYLSGMQHDGSCGHPEHTPGLWVDGGTISSSGQGMVCGWIKE